MGHRLEREALKKMDDVCALLKEGRVREAAAFIPSDWQDIFLAMPSDKATECEVGKGHPLHISPGPTDGNMTEHEVLVSYSKGQRIELRFIFEDNFLFHWTYARLKWVHPVDIKTGKLIQYLPPNHSQERPGASDVMPEAPAAQRKR